MKWGLRTLFQPGFLVELICRNIQDLHRGPEKILVRKRFHFFAFSRVDEAWKHTRKTWNNLEDQKAGLELNQI